MNCCITCCCTCLSRAARLIFTVSPQPLKCWSFSVISLKNLHSNCSQLWLLNLIHSPDISEAHRATSYHVARESHLLLLLLLLPLLLSASRSSLDFKVKRNRNPEKTPDSLPLISDRDKVEPGFNHRFYPFVLFLLAFSLIPFSLLSFRLIFLSAFCLTSFSLSSFSRHNNSDSVTIYLTRNWV